MLFVIVLWHFFWLPKYQWTRFFFFALLACIWVMVFTGWTAWVTFAFFLLCALISLVDESTV
jgi:hypothetical protein